MCLSVVVFELFVTSATFETKFTEYALEYSVYFAVLSFKVFTTFWTLLVDIFEMATDALSAVKSFTLKTLLGFPNYILTHYTLKTSM